MTGQDLSNTYAEPRYVLIKTFTFPAGSQEFLEAQQRAELMSLLEQSIEQSANHKKDRKTEQRIQKLLKVLLRKGR